MNNQDDADRNDRKESASNYTFFSESEKKVGDRIKDAIGDEPVKAFARRCGIAESSLRSYIANQKKPGLDAITAISEFTGVTVDWIATGRGIKHSSVLKEAEKRLYGAPPAVSAKLPPELEPYRQRLDALLNYLVMIDDEQERELILNDFILRAEKTIELSELKHAVDELRAAYKKNTG